MFSRNEFAYVNCSFFCDNISESGWGTNVGLGYHFFRTSSVNFATELSYTQGFYEIVGRMPSTVNFKIILLW